MEMLKYLSGEEVMRGDRINFHGEPGEVESIITGLTGDAVEDWFANRAPEGGLLLRAKVFGDVFLRGDVTCSPIFGPAET